MCGLAGILATSEDRRISLTDSVCAMTKAQIHRGPDDVGEWSDSASGIAFGHRRLRILDLSVGGRQPMVSKSGRYVLIYNGEIYNFRVLQKSLAISGSRFDTQTDTEVLLEAFDAWGIISTLKKVNGMFAIGLWDRQEKRLYLARDAFGIKPLYVGFADNALMFASEVRAIRRAVSSLSIDKIAMQEFLHFGFISAPRSIYNDFSKVLPGTVLCYSAANPITPEGFSTPPQSFWCPSFRSVSVHAFWSYSQELERGVATRCALNENEATIQLNSLLKQALSRQRVADVPVGAFLSGGIDSSVVVAILQSISNSPVRTYTIGVENNSLDESEYARRVAQHLGTNHTELRVSESHALETAKRMSRIYDEPFADSSQIPTLLVSELAANDVKVALTGDGGDEIFGGYNRHVHGVSLWRKLQSFPPGAKEALSQLAGSSYLRGTDSKIESILSNLFPTLKHRSLSNIREKIGKMSAARNLNELYFNLISNSICDNDRSKYPLKSHISGMSTVLDDARRLMFLDATDYLPNDILTKVDRASMSCSLEARVPLLDLEVVRFAATLPTSFLIKGSSGKKILKDVLKGYLPNELVSRPKMGFAVPLAGWLRGPLKEWGLATVSSAQSKISEILDWNIVRNEMDSFYSGDVDTSARVWTFVVLADWLQSET